MTGQRVGNWVLGGEVGRGPMGVVYRARGADDPARAAAVKILTHPATRDPAFLARFPAEMLGLHRLSHPNVVKFYDAGVHHGSAWYAREWVDGTDCGTLLRTRPRAGGGLGWADEVVPVAVQAARALKHGHHRSILHRDLKPSNLLLTPDGTLKVADFGVGKLFGLSPLTLPADPLGTVGFTAPEAFTGKPVTRKSDLYALGGVLYALATGRPPFAAATTAEFLHKHCYMLPDRPAHFLPDLPADLDDLICALLAKDPGRRPATAAGVLEALAGLRGKLERKGKKVAWPPDPGDASGPMPALSADDEREEPDDARPLLARWYVVLPAFLAVVAVVLAVVFWPRPTADELFARAEPHLQTDDLGEMDRVWEDDLEPLQDRYPDSKYARQVEDFRRRRADRKELQRAINEGRAVPEGRTAKFETEAERLYYRGLALARVGDADGARREWEQVLATPGADERWARLAEVGLKELARRPGG